MGTDSAGGCKKKVMNAKKWFLALSVTLAGLQCAAAQEKKQESPKAEEPVKIELPSDNIIRHFRSRNSGTAVVDWYQLKDGRNTYVIGYYSTDGDQRKVVYRNGAYFCTETEVPIEYCPARIRAAVDTLAPGLKLKDLYATLMANDIDVVGRKSSAAILVTKNDAMDISGTKAEVSDAILDYCVKMI